MSLFLFTHFSLIISVDRYLKCTLSLSLSLLPINCIDPSYSFFSNDDKFKWKIKIIKVTRRRRGLWDGTIREKKDLSWRMYKIYRKGRKGIWIGIISRVGYQKRDKQRDLETPIDETHIKREIQRDRVVWCEWERKRGVIQWRKLYWQELTNIHSFIVYVFIYILCVFICLSICL